MTVYTAEQLGAMSDVDMGRGLCELLGFDYCIDNGLVRVRKESGHLAEWSINTPNDVMPLAFEHKIGVEFIDGFGWTATHPYNQISASCYDNPLRAVVMCLILHLQERGV